MRRDTWISLLLIILAVCLAYGVSIRNERIGDDRALIPGRIAVPEASQLWTEDFWHPYDTSGLYRPIPLTLLYAEWELFGLHVVPYHLVSLALYIGCSVLCYCFTALISNHLVALFTALLFVLHPVHVEAVITAYGQAELLSASFVFLALIADLRGFQSNSPPWKAVAALAFAAALFSKEVAATFPFLAILTREIWLVRTDTPVRRRWGMPVVYVAIIGAYLAVKYAVLGGLARPDTAASFSKLRLIYLSFTHGLGNYLRLALFPKSQSMVYDTFSNAAEDAAWVVIGAIVVAIAWRVFGWRPALFATAWFGAGWFVFSNLIIPTGLFVAERVLFLPVFSICLLFGFLAERSRAVAIVLLLAAGAQTASTAWKWRDEEHSLRASIWERPPSPLTESMLAINLLQRPEKDAATLKEAESLLIDARDRFPALPEAHRGLGLLARSRGDLPQAIAHLRRGLELRPRDAFIRADLEECERLGQ